MESKPLLESRCHGEVEFAEPSTEPKAAALAGGRAHTTGLLRATRAFAAGAALLGAIGAPAIGGVVLVSRADGGTDGAHDADDGGQEGAVAHMEMVREAPASAVRGAVDGLSTMLSAQELVDEMTMSEKISLLHGQSGLSYNGGTSAIGRMGIPALNYNNGPQGIHVAAYPETSVAWPCGLALAASWDEDLAGTFGKALAKEFRGKGANVVLGPGMNIARVPTGGRNWEYSSGEDPYLGAKIVPSIATGIQSEGVMATMKHWVQNNQEEDRSGVNEVVDERTRWEIYYPPFEATVAAGVGATMCAYNRVTPIDVTAKASWACESNETLNVDLKSRMGYTGFVMSDWGATHSTVEAALNGLDQEMPTDDYFGTALVRAYEEGEVSLDVIDDKVKRILDSIKSVGLMDAGRYTWGNISANVTTEEHVTLAKTIAVQSTVLLANDGILPLSFTSAADECTIVVAGEDAVSAVSHGLGSGEVVGSYTVSPWEGIEDRAPSHCTVKWFKTASDKALEWAAKANVTIVVVGVTSDEGYDRSSLSLGDTLDDLVTDFAAVSSKTVAVVSAPGAVMMPWTGSVASTVLMFLPGQQMGTALAEIIFGDENPSGKLPVSMPVGENDMEFVIEQYPGVNDTDVPSGCDSPCLKAEYREKLEVGYRWYDAHEVEPAFPFGHGLSYTTFAYSDLTVTKETISFTLKNTGVYAGSEVAQLYLGFPADANEPPRQLKGFEKADLAAGASKEVVFTVTARDKSIWDLGTHSFQEVKGTFQVYVGGSSRDTRLSSVFHNA